MKIVGLHIWYFSSKTCFTAHDWNYTSESDTI